MSTRASRFREASEDRRGLQFRLSLSSTRIVEILEAQQLSRLDAALQHIQTLRDKAAQFRRSLLHAAFTGALTGHDPSTGELPDGWKLDRARRRFVEVLDSSAFKPYQEPETARGSWRPWHGSLLRT